MLAIDTVTGAVVKTIPVGRLPCSMTVDPADRVVYVANASSDSVSVIKPAG